MSVMLIIRLQRTGRKHEPTFRLVLTDSKNGPKSGKFLEILGSYDPRDKNTTAIKGDRIKELIKNGAQLSDTVHNLLINHKIIEGKKINVLPKKTVEKKAEENQNTESQPSQENQNSEPVSDASVEKTPETSTETTTA